MLSSAISGTERLTARTPGPEGAAQSARLQPTAARQTPHQEGDRQAAPHFVKRWFNRTPRIVGKSWQELLQGRAATYLVSMKALYIRLEITNWKAA